MRAAVGAPIVANDFLEAEVSEPMKAVSHAYVPADLTHLFRKGADTSEMTQLHGVTICCRSKPQ
jgi:hypothetical protein